MALFDLKSAFDTLTREAQVMVWERGGVPPDGSRWLGDIDEDRIIIPRTPAYESVADSCFKTNNDHSNIDHRTSTQSDITGFTAERGTPQGDGPSPLAYIAEEDILLRALDLAYERGLVTSKGAALQPMLIPTGRGSTYLTQNLGYADDLVVPAQSPENL